MEKAGIVMETRASSGQKEKAKPAETLAEKKERLNKALQEAINNENYEQAAIIKDEISKLDSSTDA